MDDIGERLINEVRRLANERPNFVYNRPEFGSGPAPCRYVHDGQPSCLVGCAAWNLGLINATIESTSMNVGGVVVLNDELGFGLSNEHVDWLSTAQSLQDDGATWATAVESADEVIPVRFFASM